MKHRANKILIVEDDPGWGDLLGRQLSQRGYEVVVASTFENALAILRDRSVYVAVAVIDLSLSPADAQNEQGMNLLEYVASSGIGIPNCIVLTAYATVARARDALKKYGAWDFVDKGNFNEREFVETVEEAFDDAVAKTRRIPPVLLEAWDKALHNIKQSGTITDFSSVTMQIASELASLLDLAMPKAGTSYKKLVAILQDVVPVFPHTGLASQMPFIFLQRDRLDDNDLEDLRYLLIHRLNPSVQVALLFFFGKSKEVVQVRDLVHARMRHPYAYDVIVFGWDDLLRMIMSRDPHYSLRQKALSQTSLITASPFVVVGPTPDNIFFGREKDLREITEHAATVSYALIGGRRIGKTSILKRLERVRLPTVGFHALYHDCSFTPTQAERVQAIAADKTWFPEIPTSPLTSFAEIIHALSGDKPLVILLDETDKLIEPDRQADYPLFNTLRAMANAGRCRFVLSGEQALRNELTNPNSPLYNFANEMLVGRLDFRAVEELVTRPMEQLEIELTDEPEMVQCIWDLTSGHPNVVQRLCQRLIVRLNQRGDRHLRLDDVEAIVVDPDFLRKDFLNIYWERSTALERLCSLVMAADESVRTLTAVHETLARHGIQATLNEVDDALERLVDLRNILQRTAEGYEFAVAAFPEVIAKTARLEDLIALNRETYQHYGDVEPRSKRGSP